MKRVRPDLLRIACEMRTTGATYHEIAKHLTDVQKFKCSHQTIWRWERTEEWQQYEELLRQQQHRAGLKRFEMYLKDFETAGRDLVEAAIANLKSLAIAQRKILEIIEQMPSNIEIETAADIGAILRAQNDIGKGLLTSYEVLEKAGGLAEFMAENTSVEIEFEAYEDK